MAMQRHYSLWMKSLQLQNSLQMHSEIDCKFLSLSSQLIKIENQPVSNISYIKPMMIVLVSWGRHEAPSASLTTKISCGKNEKLNLSSLQDITPVSTCSKSYVGKEQDRRSRGLQSQYLPGSCCADSGRLNALSCNPSTFLDSLVFW